MELTPHHVAITVTDLQRSVDFYGRLGFLLIDQYDNVEGTFSIRHLQLKSVILEIFWFETTLPLSTDARDRATDLPHVGFKHFGVHVSDIDAAWAHLREGGYEFDSDLVTGRLGFQYFFVKDPDGLLLEILEDNRACSHFL